METYAYGKRFHQDTRRRDFHHIGEKLEGPDANRSGALDCEFDFAVYPFAEPQGNANITVHGIGLAMIGQAANLNGQNVELYAGMQAGLPLADPRQAGLILKGQIFQAFGNWQGTDQTLNIVCYAGCAGPNQNIMWNWPANTSMANAIQQTFAQAFRAYIATVNISPNLRQNSDDQGHYDTLSQFASYLQQKSQAVGSRMYGEDYPGVQITTAGNYIYAFDGQGPVPANVAKIAFRDLIGQPTWIGAQTISFKTVLRADISVGMNVKLPQGISAPYAVTTLAAASPNAPASSKTAFQGTFIVQDLHHYAHLRQPDADSWNTTFTATLLPNPAAIAQGPPS